MTDAVLMFIGQVILAAVGGGGVVTVFLNRKLDAKQKEAEEKRAYRKRKSELEAEYRAALSRYTFWIAKGCERYNKAECKDYWNGEAQEAFENLEFVDNKIKELDRQFLSSKTE